MILLRLALLLTLLCLCVLLAVAGAVLAAPGVALLAAAHLIYDRAEEVMR